jgi:hypothetical protein
MCVCNDELIPPLARSLVEENRVTRAHAGNSRRMEREEKNIKSTYATIEYVSPHARLYFLPVCSINWKKSKTNLEFAAKS